VTLAAILQRADLQLRQALPALLTMLLVVLSVVPLGLPDHALVAPGLVLVALFYWTVHRPDLLPTWHAFVVGLLLDAMSGTPFGVNALVMTLVHWAVVAQHTFFRGKSFGVMWLSFALVAFAAALVGALVALVAARVVVDPLAVLIQLVLTIAAYPPLAWLLGRAQRLWLAGL
jgi:rod shape-determining protein MreD